MQLSADGLRTLVNVDTDLKISGKIAQLGGGMIAEVSQKLLGQFVVCLEAKLAAHPPTDAPDETAPAGLPASTPYSDLPDATAPPEYPPATAPPRLSRAPSPAPNAGHPETAATAPTDPRNRATRPRQARPPRRKKSSGSSDYRTMHWRESFQ